MCEKWKTKVKRKKMYINNLFDGIVLENRQNKTEKRSTMNIVISESQKLL